MLPARRFPSLGLSPLLLVVLVVASVGGCRATPRDDGNVRSLAVTGTDGKVADPAQVAPLENTGRFSFAYDIEPSKSTYVIARLKGANGSAVEVASHCCNPSGSDCTPFVTSCQYLASNTVDCGNGPVVLTDFFRQNGGLPATVRLAVETNTYACDNNVDIFRSRLHQADRGVVFR